MTESDPTAVRSASNLARDNEFFRQTIVTGEHAQLVVMTIQPGEEIGEETHEGDQILHFVKGNGEAISRRQEKPRRPSRHRVRPGGHAPQLRKHGRRPTVPTDDLCPARTSSRHRP